jgi:hypothetical protein
MLKKNSEHFFKFLNIIFPVVTNFFGNSILEFSDIRMTMKVSSWYLYAL